MKALAGFVGSCAIVLAGCAVHSATVHSTADQSTVGGTSSAVTASGGFEASDLSTQRILRARYQGNAGQGSFRLVLRVGAADHYEVTASDLLGRQLWAFSVQGGGLRFVDHRGRRACEADQRFQLEAAVALSSIPLEALPAILLGRLPPGLRSDPGDDTGSRFLDGQWRLWTLLREESTIVGWTLWEKEEPLIWLQHRDGSGILSSRQGSQLRWRQTLIEDLEDLPGFALPADFELVECSEIGLTETDLLAEYERDGAVP